MTHAATKKRTTARLRSNAGHRGGDVPRETMRRAMPDDVRAVIAALPNDRIEALRVLDVARRLVERFKR